MRHVMRSGSSCVRVIIRWFIAGATTIVGAMPLASAQMTAPKGLKKT